MDDSNLSTLAAAGATRRLQHEVPGLSASARLELAWLIGGARQLARISCEANAVRSVCDSLGHLGLLTAPVAAVRSAHSSPDGDYVFSVTACSATGQGAADRYLLFVSSDLDVLLTAVSAENEAVIGAALGYPSCCVAHFMAARDDYMCGFAPCFAQGLGVRPYWANPLLDPLGALLVSHFPCAPYCEGTRTIARSNLEVLRRDDPLAAVDLLRRLRSIVGWHETLGLVAFTDPYSATRNGELRLSACTPQWRVVLGSRYCACADLESRRIILNDGSTIEAVSLADYRGGYHDL